METAPEPSYGRAGRNLIAAIGVGLVLGLGLVLAPILWAPWVFAFVVAAAMVIGALEIETAYANRDVTLVRWPLLAGAGALPLCAYYLGPTAMVAAFAAALLVIWALRLAGPTDCYVADAGASSFVLAYTGLLGGFAALTLAAPDGGARIISFVVLTICSDIGGYAAGALFGRHPIAPRVSPKKSWEGLAGSLVLQSVAGVLLFVHLLHGTWWQGLIAGLVLTVSATLGDFVESAVKRDLGVKDMGTVLPGHGGLMDRLDSLLPNAFVSWALFTRFLGP